MFDMKFEDEAKGRVAFLTGRLDTKAAQDFEKMALSWECRNVVLDFTDLEYISSAGLRSILVLAKRLLPLGGKLVLFGMSGVVEEVFGVSGFDSFLPVARSREDALALLPE